MSAKRLMIARTYLGLELGGVRSARSSLCVLEHYVNSERLVLSLLVSKLGTAGEQDPDAEMCLVVQNAAGSGSKKFGALAVTAPLGLPPFFKPKGSKARRQEERWLGTAVKKLAKHKRTNLPPYTHRPCDVYLRYFDGDTLDAPEALGSNLAPLTARAIYLKEKLPKPIVECHVKASLLRLAASTDIKKTLVKSLSSLEHGLDARQKFLEQFLKKVPALFIYEKDFEQLVLELPSFYAFVAAVTAFLYASQACEPRPPLFPPNADWPALPRRSLRWSDLVIAN